MTRCTVSAASVVLMPQMCKSWNSATPANPEKYPRISPVSIRGGTACSERLTESRSRSQVLPTMTAATARLITGSSQALANESARELFGFEDQSLPGTDVAPYLPILHRMLKNPHSAANLRTNVECKAHRFNGEVFLAHVWLSTYRTSQGAGLAAVVWDASENLRDREGSGRSEEHTS